jgi:NADH dehydrogenase [ubiquinone] 1 alpha subcomplex assembly factor 7
VNALARHLAARIRADGPLSVATYMAEVLGHPQHGYYTTRDPFGPRGDFITAPEISQMFGELVGLWCVAQWQRLGEPEPFVLAEIGPGRGTLMADALRAAKLVPGFIRSCRVHLIENSAMLRQAQAQALTSVAIEWHADFATLPAGPLLLVANEFLDALPVRQLVRALDGWHERRVDLAGDGETLRFVLDRAPITDAELVPPALRQAPPDALIELRPAATELAQALARRLAADGGAALFIDYGHGANGCGETLQAVRRHGRHELLDEPGAADLSAHVDFAAFAAAATEAGGRAWGPVTQGDWLRALGIEARAATLLAKADAAQSETIRSGCRRLIDPAQMGALFKVMAITPRDVSAPDGFA